MKSKLKKAREIWQTTLLRKINHIEENKKLRKAIGFYEDVLSSLPLEQQERLEADVEKETPDQLDMGCGVGVRNNS
jgi:hypothetical protein